MDSIRPIQFQSLQRENSRPEPEGVSIRDSVTIGSSAPEKEWTVLFYVDGKEGAPMARSAMKKLKTVGSDENVNLVAQLTLEKKGTKRGLLEKTDTKAIFPGSQNIGNVNMGDPETLKKFIEWGMEKYPAKHYALVLWDHGAGYDGIMSDEETKQLIDSGELADVFKTVKDNTGRSIELVNFSGKLVGQAEVAYDLRDTASYMVSSEDAAKSSNKYVSRILGDPQQIRVMKDLKAGIREKGTITPEELARLYVFESRYQPGHSTLTPTQSAFDLSRMDDLRTSLDNLAGLLLAKIKEDPSVIDIIRKDMGKTTDFFHGGRYIKPYVDYRDLGDFAVLLSKDKHFEGTEISRAAGKLLDSVKKVVIAEEHTGALMGGKMLDGATGMSIYLPKDYGYETTGRNNGQNSDTPSYENHQLVKDSQWTQFLAAISRDDDWKAKLARKIPKGSAILEAMMEMHESTTCAVLCSVVKSIVNFAKGVIPPALFPFMIPIHGIVPMGAGLVGGALKAQKGIEKTITGTTREFASGKNRKLAVDGMIDTVVGLGSIVTCTALFTGLGYLALPLGLALGGLSAARSMLKFGVDFKDIYRASKMNVSEKLSATENRQPEVRK